MAKVHKETFEGNRYADFIDYGDGFMAMYIVKMYQIVYSKYMNFHMSITL